MAAAVATGGEPLAGLALIAPPLSSPGWARAGGLRVEGPLLIVAGSEDPYCPRPALRALGRTLPAATILVLEGADHFLHSGSDRLAAALGDWAARIAA